MPDPFDAAIVGGGPAGLSAALTLGRCCRRVLVADGGAYRNAPAEAAHGVFTRDGAAPADLLRIAREDLAPYDITLREGRVTHAERTGDGFALTFEDGERVEARKLLLAAGVEDVLPEVPGLRERWGRSVFHCPYCHGWEVQGEPVGLYGRGEDGYNLVGLLRGWSRDLVLFTDGPSGLSEEEGAHLARLGVPVREERVERLEGEGDQLEAVVLEGGERVPRTALYLKPEPRPHSDLARQLGCPSDEDGCPEAEGGGITPVPGLFVAGDLGPNVHQVLSAAASGSEAAITLNEELLKEAFEATEP
jgi:thioredoxin reductase